MQTFFFCFGGKNKVTDYGSENTRLISASVVSGQISAWRRSWIDGIQNAVWSFALEDEILQNYENRSNTGYLMSNVRTAYSVKRIL